ncbi:MAG: GDP-L-fucose synthase [Planctomycetota bacterium]
MHPQDKIFVAGHRGLVGSAIVRNLQKQGFTRLLMKTHHELDLEDDSVVKGFFQQEKPDYVFLAAAKVGGIHANNTYPVDFLQRNLKIQLNLIENAYHFQVKKLLFLGSSCIYPRLAPQPMKEEYLLSGPLEPTNQAYAIAKIAGIVLCQSYNRQYGTQFISAMPTNVYGIQDNFDLQSSHVLPALIRKFHEAMISKHSEVVLWGTGTPRREFIFAEDLAEGLIFLMQNYHDSEIVNVGIGEDISIRELAELIARIVGFSGKLIFDPLMPDGTPRKLLDVQKLSQLGWRAKTPLEEGIRETYEWYRSQ